MNFTYRQSGIEDLESITEIYSGAQKFMESQGNPQWPAGFPAENDIKYGIFGGLLYCVVVNGEIAAVFAVAGYDRDYDEIDGAWLTDGRYLAVHRIAVKEKFRGSGAAKYIVNFAAVELAKSRGRASIRMDTHEKNKPMRGLLTSQGFKECGIIKLFRDDTSRIAFERKI